MPSGFLSRSKTVDLGLELRPGDRHHRAYVGPPRDYDLVSAMVFNLLTCMGLRQHHRVLDIGCGSLRVGRLLIPYLNAGGYVGVEPNKWLVDDGVRFEVGRDLVRLRRPTFVYGDSLESLDEPLGLDFAVAQSIFSHCGPDLVDRWLAETSAHLEPTGALLGTFRVDEQDNESQGWIYPGVVGYTVQTMESLAAEHGFTLTLLDWAHPRQTWGLFAKPGFDDGVAPNGVVSWNRVVERAKGPPR